MRYTIFFLSLFYSFIFSSLSAAYGARNEDVKYRNCKWDATNKVVVVEEDTKKCTLIEGQNNEWQGLGEKGVATYYAVKGNVKRKTLNCFGEVHLIICDGATLTCTGGIKAEKKNAAEIYIHAQSDGDNRGNLVVSNSYKGAAGIGAATDQMARTPGPRARWDRRKGTRSRQASQCRARPRSDAAQSSAADG